MFRIAAAKLINVAKNSTSRPLSAKTPKKVGNDSAAVTNITRSEKTHNDPLSSKVDWVKTQKTKASKTGEATKKQKHESPCDEFTKSKTPCSEVEKLKNPREAVKIVQSPCDEMEMTRKQASKSPCEDKKIQSMTMGSEKKSESSSNCFHHKDLVPPASILSQMKHFELRSDCSSFHMKSSGHDRKA
jgi:hypothetical protein